MQLKKQEGNKCTHKVMFWGVRVIFIPPRLS